MSTRYTRARFGAAVVVAFLCGLIFASGFDLTRFGWAQGKVTSANKPSAAEIAPAADLESAFEAVADHARPAVVSIETERFARTRPASRQRRGGNGQLPPSIEDLLRGYDDRAPSDTPEEASGSGFIVSPDGYILTNNHVVADADRVTVTLFDKTVYNAKVVGRDPSTDVAVIKIDGKSFPTVNLGDDAKSRVGQWVLAIGNPLQLDFTVTAGIVSAKGRNQSALLNPNGQNPYAITDYIQTDAAINPGNSGGPLLNIRGDVIGINSAIASGTGYYAGYGFAIPITLAKQVMDDLIKYGKVKRAIIGITLLDVTPNDAKAAGLPHAGGAKVTGFPENTDSPGQKAGLEVGDIIITADGKPVDQVNTLQRIIRGHKPGDVVTVEAMRFGSKKTFSVKLAEAVDPNAVPANNDDAPAPGTRPTANPAGAPNAAKPAAARPLTGLGITVETLSPEFLAQTHLLPQYRSGLRVASVAGNGPAYRNLGPNQIILGVLHPQRKDIKSVDELQSIVAGMKSGDVIELKVCFPNPTDGSCQTNAVGVQIEK